MKKKIHYFLAVVLMAAFGAVFYICWQSETFHRLASPEERAVISDKAEICIKCHEQEDYNRSAFVIPGWRESKHGLNGVGCDKCHIVNDNALKEKIAVVAKIRGIGDSDCKIKDVTNVIIPDICKQCHEKQVKEFESSRHGKAWSGGIQQHKQLDKEGKFIDFNKDCASCHLVEFRCNSCHTMHKFSAKNARKPETCGICHSGDRHPQSEKYFNSHHGIIYKSEGDKKVPTCVTCHMSDKSHDVYHPDVKDPKKLFVCSRCHDDRDAVAIHAVDHKSYGAKKYAHEVAKKAKESEIPMCIICHPGE